MHIPTKNEDHPHFLSSEKIGFDHSEQEKEDLSNSQDIGMEFGIEKCYMLIMKSDKWPKKQNYQINKKSERLEKTKLTSTWEYWKRTS